MDVHPGEEKVVWRLCRNLPVPEGAHMEVREGPFVRSCKDRTGNSRYKLKKEKSKLDIRRNTLL